MFERFSQTAERLAIDVSRRQFLGRLGRGAAVLAAGLGGLLALPASLPGRDGPERGNPCGRGFHKSQCPSGLYVCCPTGTKCQVDFFCS